MGWQVSEIGYGMWGMAGWTGSDDQESLRALDRALALGCNFFDTAWAYGAGKSEQLLGQALAKKRTGVRVAMAASAFLVVSGHDEEAFASAIAGVEPGGMTIVALMGVGLSVLTHDGVWDGVGTLAIGVLLVCIALQMASMCVFWLRGGTMWRTLLSNVRM